MLHAELDSPEDPKRLSTVPHLVIEVLPTDRAADQMGKLSNYGAAGLPEYWIVAPEGPMLTRYHLSSAGFAEASRHGPGGRCELVVAGASVVLDVDALVHRHC